MQVFLRRIKRRRCCLTLNFVEPAMAERAIRMQSRNRCISLLHIHAASFACATLNLPRVHFPYRFFSSLLLVVPILLFFVLCEAQLSAVAINVNAPIWGSFGADKRTVTFMGSPNVAQEFELAALDRKRSFVFENSR